MYRAFKLNFLVKKQLFVCIKHEGHEIITTSSKVQILHTKLSSSPYIHTEFSYIEYKVTMYIDPYIPSVAWHECDPLLLAPCPAHHAHEIPISGAV